MAFQVLNIPPAISDPEFAAEMQTIVGQIRTLTTQLNGSQLDTEAAAVTNLNSLSGSGTYFIASANAVAGGAPSAHDYLVKYIRRNGDVGIQQAYRLDEDYVYERREAGGTWGGWIWLHGTGSNANGQWRVSSVYQECSFKVTLTKPGSSTVLDATWTYPRSFFSLRGISCTIDADTTVGTNDTEILNVFAQSEGNTSAAIYVKAVSGVTFGVSDTVNVWVRAEGNPG